MGQISWLEPATTDFPATSLALDEPNGLLAAGGDLSLPRMLAAYEQGIFPWYSDNDPILWWSPDPRLILDPREIHINRSTRKLAKKQPYTFSVDKAFSAVIRHCAQAPRDGAGTWITEEMIEAYCSLYEAGFAHSVEAWKDGELIGGLYGIALGKVFFGESMFSRLTGASRLAFCTLCLQLQAWGFELIDCQVHSDYLESLGAREISRKDFESRLRALVKQKNIDWKSAWAMPPQGYDGSLQD